MGKEENSPPFIRGNWSFFCVRDIFFFLQKGTTRRRWTVATATPPCSSKSKRKNLIVSDKKHFDSADWSRSRQLGVVSSAGNGAELKDDDEEILKPVLGAKDVPGTSPPSDASTFTTTNTARRRREERAWTKVAGGGI